MKWLLSLLCALLSVGSAASAAPKEISGKRLEVRREASWSPDKKYKVETIPYLFSIPDSRRSHLFLIRQGEKKRRTVKLDRTNGYDHFVQVLWCPNSRFFAVNLWDPGRTASSYLYNVNDLGHRIDIAERLKGLIKDKNHKRFFSGITSMGPTIVATRWLNSGWLEISLEDDKVDEPGRAAESFALTYRWNLRDKLVLVQQDAASWRH